MLCLFFSVDSAESAKAVEGNLCTKPQLNSWIIPASSLVIFNIIAPFLIQDTLHYSAIGYGHIALFLGFGYFLGGLVNLGVIHWVSAQKIILFSLVAAIGATVILLLTGMLVETNIYTLVAPVFFLFFFCGLMYPNIMTMNLSLFPALAGTASAILGFWISVDVFVFTTIASLVGRETEISLAFLYLAMCGACIALFYPVRKC